MVQTELYLSVDEFRHLLTLDEFGFLVTPYCLLGISVNHILFSKLYVCQSFVESLGTMPVPRDTLYLYVPGKTTLQP